MRLTHQIPDVKLNCALVTDLTNVPKSCFQEQVLDGEQYSMIDYDLLLENLPSGLMKFSIKIDGTEYKAIEATY